MSTKIAAATIGAALLPATLAHQAIAESDPACPMRAEAGEVAHDQMACEAPTPPMHHVERDDKLEAVQPAAGGAPAAPRNNGGMLLMGVG